ncbi:MAG: hypothetical protein ACWGQW_24495, partial [bacterium]
MNWGGLGQRLNRRTMLRSLAAAGICSSIFKLCKASSGSASPETGALNTSSAPSDLKITDMRACTVAANYDYPIIRIDTNQGVYGLGEVRDAGVKGIA